MMHTFIFNPEAVDNQEIILSGSEAHHIAKVLRFGSGEVIRLVDGRGMTHICEIVSITSKQVACRIVKTIKRFGEPAVFMTLAVGLSAASKFDIVIEKGTEIGVSRFVPLLCDKGKVKLGDAAAVTRKMNRWRRICEAAVKQSGRSVIPDISGPVEFDDFIETCNFQHTFLFHPSDNADNFGRALTGKSTPEMILLVGPESGFSDRELALATERGVPVVSMGPRVLRTETAGTVIPALIIYLHDIVRI